MSNLPGTPGTAGAPPPPAAPPQHYPQRPPSSGMSGWVIALIVVVPLTFIIGILAAVAIPSFMKYVRRSKVTEARMNVRRIHTAAEAYRAEHGRAPSTTLWTPPISACEVQGRKHPPLQHLWQQEGWSEIHFSIDQPFYYQYRLENLGGGGYLVSARGDLDCDGVFSTFTMEGTAGGLRRGIQVENEIE